MSDFCYGRPMLSRIFRQAELMDRVMERLGIDPSVAARLDKGMAWYEARTKCIACCSDRRCRSWLDRSDVSHGAPQFCANVEFFRRCDTIRPNDGHPLLSSLSADGGTP